MAKRIDSSNYSILKEVISYKVGKKASSIFVRSNSDNNSGTSGLTTFERKVYSWFALIDKDTNKVHVLSRDSYDKAFDETGKRCYVHKKRKDDTDYTLVMNVQLYEDLEKYSDPSLSEYATEYWNRLIE